jgi:hypothetical protein
MIAPNPTHGKLNLQFYPDASKIRHIELLNATGQRVYAVSYPSANAPASLSLDLGRFSAGIYTLRIHGTDRVITERIVRN